MSGNLQFQSTGCHSFKIPVPAVNHQSSATYRRRPLESHRLPRLKPANCWVVSSPVSPQIRDMMGTPPLDKVAARSPTVEFGVVGSMAPSRRRGVSKAAAAAAARRKWKVGELVLAKVKGFPAWPATVSEPGKWGYAADYKKIVVQFFGCEQMFLFLVYAFLGSVIYHVIVTLLAFCNPVDIEEFTEEKKVSLLGKRHGKGADFVRAANEIIECYEKLKKQEQVSGPNGTEETAIVNENYLQDSVVASRKDEAPVVKVDPLSAGTTNDLDSLTKAAVAAATDDAFENENIHNAVFNKIPASTPYLTRNKTDVARSRNSGSTKKKPVRRLRSSSRTDNRLQSTTLPSVNSNRSSRRFGVSASDRSLRRSRRIVKSSDESDGQNIDPLAIKANDYVEEGNSGTLSVNSDTISVDDGSTVDSVSKPVGTGEPTAENNEGETELSDRLDFQSNNVMKKKRKPNRKRHNNGTVDAPKLNIVVSDAEEIKTELVSPSFSEKPDQKQAKDDSDEHLPLVKRARVRMGRPSPTAEAEFPSVQREERLSEVPERCSVQSYEPLSSKVEDHANKESVPVKEKPALSSLVHESPANRPRFWETRKNFVDGEAALPPSKRLHRALEAMSANVAEDCRRTFNSSPAANIQSNGYCASSSLECYEMSEERKEMTGLGSETMDDLPNGDSVLSAPQPCVVSDVRSEIDAEITTRVVPECGKANTTDCKANTTDGKANTTESKNPEMHTGSGGEAEGDGIRGPDIIPFVEVHVETDIIAEDHLKMETENLGDQLANLNCNAPSAVMSPTDHCITGCTELKEAAKGSDFDILQIPADSTSMQDIAVGIPDIDICNRSDDNGGEAHKTKDLPSVEHNPDSMMCEYVEEARPSSLNSKIMQPVTPMKVLNSGHVQSLAYSTYSSNEHMEDKTVSATQSSSSLTDGPESVARTSPPSSSICHMSALDNKRSLLNNSSCCPDVHLHLEKAKLAGKSSSKSEALSSFEAIIKSLTRTKESIGRATRIAIDCAKFGFATKHLVSLMWFSVIQVVEILAHNLETESSLHKKVDLFFLVDSITQCSRGIKGDGGVYPSAIQALLPRLLLAAAPPSSSSHENHRQCLKVLKVWQERKILPEPIIRHHIRELDALCGSYPTMGSNRTLRNERAFDDPIREMEGMMVDEYGRYFIFIILFDSLSLDHHLLKSAFAFSNSSIQLPGFCMPRILGDDDDAGSDSDGESFEAVTPEHNVDNHEGDSNPVHAIEKHRHILEDVDGELEMEDVAPCCEDEIASNSNFVGLYSSSQNYSGNLREPTSVGHHVHHRVRENKDYEAEVPRHVQDNGCFSDRHTSRFSSRSCGSEQPNDGYGKSFHLRPPHPAPSNQFSYVQEQRVHSRRDAPPPSRPNRFHSRNSDNGNFYRDRDRNKYVQRDNIGEGWRPPYPSISGQCYHDESRMANGPMPYGGPPREPPGPHNRWNYPSRPMNHRHFNPYRLPSEGPIPAHIGGQDNKLTASSSKWYHWLSFIRWCIVPENFFLWLSDHEDIRD
ncbi:hepatoma-derived growth factor-related protein [Striga asiatica]|uniref:Hepatoma-derived growth factor-related protein n=1 Tax=Striga asiatica TaxID=4170 RepID=A0A5A7NWB4_STRAF|nr:hepatoma-derived growth factor-related protein [Striga asiatica]